LEVALTIKEEPAPPQTDTGNLFETLGGSMTA